MSSKSSKPKGSAKVRQTPVTPSVLGHELVPKHEIMRPEEVRELLERYKITVNELPRILVSDPVVKELGANPGDVLRITRSSPTAGVATYFRLVVREE
jgi:DNA-directed RNA polymerase subunit H